MYPCKPQFYYIKVGCKGVFITRTCFHDVLGSDLTDVLAAGGGGGITRCSCFQRLLIRLGDSQVGLKIAGGTSNEC